MPRGNYQITTDRFEAIADNCTELPPETVEATLLYDWPEGQEHQDWLNTADPQEIADWVTTVNKD